jgi:hypothetical protein
LRQKTTSSAVPTAGQPSFTTPSPSSSVAFAQRAPVSSGVGRPPALGFATCTCSNASIGSQTPLRRKPMELVVGAPPPGSQSFSTNWSTLSAPADVADQAYVPPRPSCT